MNRDTGWIPPAPGLQGRSIVGAVALLVALAGDVVAVETRQAKVHNTAREVLDRVGSGLTLSPCARQSLARHGLLGPARSDPQATALLLEAQLQSAPAAEPGGLVALAELWYRAGLERSPREPAAAAVAFRDAAAAAALALGDPNVVCSDRAIEVHNDAVARLIRLSQDERLRGNAHWTTALAGLGVTVAASHPFVDPGRFATVEVAGDIRVNGMRNIYRSSGLGVPVVGMRPADRAHPSEPSEQFYPPKLRIGATTVAVPGGGLAGGAWRAAPVVLVFHDPFRFRSVSVGGRVVPMAYDTTTPLAEQASTNVLSLQTYLGLIASDFQKGIEPGLYMLRPWQAGKIPVVFVHGLSSSPAAFVQTLNDLRNDPVIAARYQFLLFAYPTGRPIPNSAVQLRRALYQAETAFGADPAFHQMVVVGHSMGGNLTRMTVTDSGLTLWNAVFNVPYGQLRASQKTLDDLTEMLIFRPVPFVRRIVFIATPHQGSRLADEPLGRIVSRFIRPPETQTAVLDELKRLNGPDALKDEFFRSRSINSIGNLSPSSPVLLTVASLPIAPGVAHHTIAYHFLGMAPTDLVVRSWSSRVAEALSEANFPGTHFSEQSPATIGELRRILLEHLASQGPG